jgi:hypothetical protein
VEENIHKNYCFLLIPSGCKTRSSLIQNLSRFSRWKSLHTHRQFCSMMRIFILLKSPRLWSDSLKCWLTGRNVFFVRSLLCPFSQHFRLSDHSLEDFNRMKIVIIEQNCLWSDFQRENRERFLIKELRVLHPDGINRKQ